jgi:hypothetical protein
VTVSLDIAAVEALLAIETPRLLAIASTRAPCREHSIVALGRRSEGAPVELRHGVARAWSAKKVYDVHQPR